MKGQNSVFLILSLFLFLSSILKVNTDSNTFQTIVDKNSEFPKPYTLKDGNVVCISSAYGNLQQTNMSKFTKDGISIYGNYTISKSYSEDAHIVQPVNADYYLIASHDKLTAGSMGSKENIFTIKDKSAPIKTVVRKEGIYQKTSVVALKNGNVFIAGIGPKTTFGGESVTDINIYNPSTLASGEGLSFKGSSDYISCFEQKENNVYCVYVSYEDVFVSKLKIKHIEVNGNTLNEKGDQVIKAFYVEFNFLKAIPFNEDESLILFQTGNGGSKPGHHGGNLFFYHLKVTTAPFLVTVKRYEYLYPYCLYEKGKHDPEHKNADIAVLSPHRIYAACETSYNRFRGFIIYPNKPEKVEIDEFYFNNFEAEDVKSPMFTKFGQSLGIFYTLIDSNLKRTTAFHIMNYPDCHNYRTIPVLLPRGFAKELDFDGKVFLNNPYPADRAKEDVYIRFKNYSNIEITRFINRTTLKSNIDYLPSIILRFTTKEKTGIYNIEYTATRNDEYDGLIIGKTCSVSFNTPKCLDRCESCTQLGDDKHHYCLGCREDGAYYEEEDPALANEGYGRPHYCRDCNESCSTCYGEFLLKPFPTTNCKKCKYDSNYFHYEYDERTCISNETKKYWESVIGSAIYLDKSAGEDKKYLWRWRHCHENCDECYERGDNFDNKCFRCKKDLYFWCNQTLGNGIPGSCHRDCVNNGFYEVIREDRAKCCPCLDKCKECKNETKCDKCYKPFLLTPEHDRCNETCGYCLAEDRNLGECVNCKTRYRTPKYKLNKTCVDEIPFIEKLKRYHHIIDDTCNLLHGCKEGCHICDPWYTDNCTQCDSSYYKQDFYGRTEPKTFHCYNKTTCQGITPYKHNESLRIGGVAILENGINVCLNCKYRNDSFRLPENNFYCGNKINRTYIDIDEYNKLSYCYFRCKSCDYWGNAMLMNCSSCRDSNYYELFKVNKYGNCYRKKHKCGIYPYYHDYDLAEVLGKDEDNCGEDCDVCLYNFTCTETFPFFVFETHECVEYCPLYDVLGNVCSTNQRGGMILLDNPFGLKNRYDFLNTTLSLNQIISSKIFEYFISSYDIDANLVKNNINNYLGNGQVYNLPESKIIVGNNISIELSSVKLELDKFTELLSGKQTTTKNNSIIDLSACQTILKKKYGLPDAEDLWILKGDTIEQISEKYLSNQVNYQLFSSSLGAFLPLNDCKETGTTAKVGNFLNSTLFTGLFQSKTAAVTDDGYNPFDYNSAFYNDICTPFTNENGNDVLLEERRKDYFNKENNLCEKGCQFLEYNEEIKMYTCNCSIKSSINDDISFEVTPMVIPEDFNKKKFTYSNIKVFKCASQVFSSKGQKMNFGSYALLACFVAFVSMVVLYFVKGRKAMDIEFTNILKPKSIPANPPKDDKPENKEKEGYDDFIEPKVKKVNVDVIYNDEELNSVDYDVAIEKDKRSFIQYYWSLLKLKQLCIFTFYTNTDHNLRCVKIALFTLFLSFYFAFTALFFNDSIMRAIYTYKGNTDAAVHVTNIILSSLCTLIMSFIVRYISLSERDIMAIKREKEEDNRKSLKEKTKNILKIKIICLFAISGLLIGLCWYYVSAFCAVFKNSQGNYFINTLVAFIVCNIWPCVTSLIAPIFRIKSIKDKNSECMYKISQIIAYF